MVRSGDFCSFKDVYFKKIFILLSGIRRSSSPTAVHARSLRSVFALVNSRFDKEGSLFAAKKTRRDIGWMGHMETTGD